MKLLEVLLGAACALVVMVVLATAGVCACARARPAQAGDVLLRESLSSSRHLGLTYDEGALREGAVLPARLQAVLQQLQHVACEAAAEELRTKLLATMTEPVVMPSCSTLHDEAQRSVDDMVASLRGAASEARLRELHAAMMGLWGAALDAACDPATGTVDVVRLRKLILNLLDAVCPAARAPGA